MTPEQLLNALTAVAAFLCLAVCWSIQKQGKRMIRKANEGNPPPTTSDNPTPIYEKDGKYFQEIQVPWSEATAEERDRWASYNQGHVKRMVECILMTPSQIREVYFDGFNQAHYSHVHPETFPPKECEQAAADYFKAKNIKMP